MEHASTPESAQQRRAELNESAENQLLSLMSIIARSKREVANRMEHLLTPAALPVMGVILRTRSITQSEICELLLIDKAALSRLVARLEELKLVTREVDPDDRRVSHLIPTALAVDSWREWLESWRKDLREKISHWSDEDLGALIALLDRLNFDIQGIAPHCEHPADQ